MAKLETISETASPAPWRLACRRTNQLPIPASGASRTRLAIGTPPISNGSVSSGGIPRMDQPQALQGEQIVDFVDRLAEGDDRRGEATGRQQLRLGKFGFEAFDDPVDHPGEAIDEAGVDRRPGGSTDRRLRLAEVDPGDPGGPV